MAVRYFGLLLLLLWLPVQAGISVLDDAGHALVFARPAQRIISLAPHITELLFAAGAGAQLVGVSEFSDYPETARTITRIGGGGGLDLEAIIALQPDLVVAWQSGNPEAGIGRLRALGIPVFISEPRYLGDVPDTLLRLGQLAGTGMQASAQAEAFTRRLLDLGKQYAGQTAVRVFYQVWDQPLMTVNGEHLISDVIRLCGGSNVFGGLPALAPQINVEAVLAADPDVIVIGSDDAGLSAELQAWRQWPAMKAVAQDQLYTVRRELLVRHSPRILDGAEQLCAILEKARSEKRMATEGHGKINKK
jgi:iron complex transport system substrate-binding protein